jgi:hypothetical protein
MLSDVQFVLRRTMTHPQLLLSSCAVCGDFVAASASLQLLQIAESYHQQVCTAQRGCSGDTHSVFGPNREMLILSSPHV